MIIIYLAVAGACAEQEANAGGGGGGGGGGGSASVSVATTSSGNYDNAVKVGIWNGQGQDFSYSAGIEDGSNSTFGTASSPTRTTQSFDIAASDYISAYNNNAGSGSQVIIGGYIRSNNYTSSNKHGWFVGSTALVSSTMSNGGSSVAVFETKTGAQSNQVNTSMPTGSTLPKGIYSSLSTFSGTGYYKVVIIHGSGRGAATLPAAGDNFTIRLSVEDQDASTTYTAIHDVTINFT